MINKCFANGGLFPEDVVKSQVYMLEGVNVARWGTPQNKCFSVRDYPLIVDS